MCIFFPYKYSCEKLLITKFIIFILVFCVCIYASVRTQFVFFCFKGVITLESLGKRGYRVPPSGTIQVVCVL